MTNILRGISHTLAAITSNCSEFEEAWNSARENGFEGRWIGEWQSETNQHHGELRCVIRQSDNHELRAIVHARYAKWMRVCYMVNLRVDELANELHLHGEADLGELAGGIYRYEGTLTPEKFECRYECKYDRGLFRLSHEHPS